MKEALECIMQLDRGTETQYKEEPSWETPDLYYHES